MIGEHRQTINHSNYSHGSDLENVSLSSRFLENKGERNNCYSLTKNLLLLTCHYCAGLNLPLQKTLLGKFFFSFFFLRFYVLTHEKYKTPLK